MKPTDDQRAICGTRGTPNLTTCQAERHHPDQTKQIALKDDEIKALKKQRGFWKRLDSELKKATVYIGIGATLARVL